jgi:DNA invertase Pin-like site-specific DNA recombinase
MIRKTVPTAPPLVISYMRFSTKAQELGDSERRQINKTEAYCNDHGLTLSDTRADRGLSGFHAVNRIKGALGVFLEQVHKGLIPVGSLLIVEDLDRLSREEPLQAMNTFSEILLADIKIVTLIDQQEYDRENMKQQPHRLFQSISLMIAAHAQSAVKSDRVRESWARRRNNPAKNPVPCWINRDAAGNLSLNKEKAAIVKRLFKDVQTMGLSKLAMQLNAENIPTISTKKRRERDDFIWDASGIYSIIRGKQVLGLQQVGTWVGGKRILTGQEIEAYPAVVTEDEWNLANLAIDSRKSGARNGRNVNTMSNVFGDLCRCSSCGSRMIVRKKTWDGSTHYLGCVLAHSYGKKAKGQAKCTNRTYHRVSDIERRLTVYIGAIVTNAENPQVDDPLARIEEKINFAKAEAAKLTNRYTNAFNGFGDDPDPLAKANLERLSKERKGKLAEVAALERERSRIKAQGDTDQISHIRTMWHGLHGLDGLELIETRRTVAAALPGLVKQIVCNPDGKTDIDFKYGVPTVFRANAPAEAERRMKAAVQRIGKATPEPDKADAAKRSKEALEAFRKQGSKCFEKPLGHAGLDPGPILNPGSDRL